MNSTLSHLNSFYTLMTSHDSSVGIVKSYVLEFRGSTSSRGKRFLSLLHSFQTCSDALPASCPMGTGGSVSGVKRPGHEADHSPPSSAEVNNGRTMFLFPHTPSRCGA
jgi:hypothetical protein